MTRDDTCPACSCSKDESRAAVASTWVRCDVCLTWYHWRCVGTSGGDLDAVDQWYCNGCLAANAALSVTLKAPARKSFRKRTQRDYASLNSGTGSDPRRWPKILEQKSFKDNKFKRLDGSDVSLQWLENDETAMTEPIIVEQPDGLGMRMPPAHFTVDDVVDHVGADTPLEVIDVATQSASPGWTLGKWSDYYNLEPDARERICNVISLEISGTTLSDKILPPKFVRDLDWVENYWPSTRKGKGHSYPKVQLYCLMGVAYAWTDWHIDFAGSSVYYHILRGSKVFYFIRPTLDNLKAYERWSGTELQNHTWLGDLVDEVYKVELKHGNTMIIPAGWIHAVYTPVDTLVFGGNFLHSFDVEKHRVLRDLKSTSGASPSRRVLDSHTHLANFLISEVRIMEGENEISKKEAKEQVPADRVKDAAAMARELRWRLRLACGDTSEDEGSTTWKIKANGHKRKRTTSLSPFPEESGVPFRNFQPKTWDRVLETPASHEIKSMKRRQPDYEEDWTPSWVDSDREEEDGVDVVEVRTQRNCITKIRRTTTGLERHRIERVVEEWKW
ncbi:hypothetical protein H0H93_008665 [Arthromyces matolae]|nr:hypothetical protein H0H93_008665 [Arthromyces matolae]